MAEKLTEFDYLLNAMRHAGQEVNPAQAGYGDKRRALFAHVRAMEKDAERYRGCAGARTRMAPRWPLKLQSLTTEPSGTLASSSTPRQTPQFPACG